jgi:hypothetical protein
VKLAATRVPRAELVTARIQGLSETAKRVARKVAR